VNAGNVSANGERAAPTHRHPLKGLEYLSKVALLGREKIIEKAAESVNYVWRDIAVAGTIVVIAGGPGEGKTTLLFLILAARMSEGRTSLPLLGRAIEPAPDGKWIVLIEGEHGEASTCRKLVQSCALLDIKDLALQRVIIVARKAVRIGSPEWSDVTRLVAAGLVSDIALDTLARVAPAEGNDEREQVAIFEIVAQTIDAAKSDEDKPAVWVNAHTRKGAVGELADVSGSTQRTGQADTVLIVKAERVDGRVASSTVTFLKLREDPDDYPPPVTFVVARDEKGVRRLHYPSAQVDDGAPLETQILNQLALGPRTKTALAEKLRRSKGDVDYAITNLFGARKIATTEVSVRGRQRKAFTLRFESAPKQPAAAGNGSGE
jgi:hypothetical protein